jgi:hypothetical protein
MMKITRKKVLDSYFVTIIIIRQIERYSMVVAVAVTPVLADRFIAATSSSSWLWLSDGTEKTVSSV